MRLGSGKCTRAAEEEPAASEDAYGGLIAANRALERLLARLVDLSVARSAGR
jgi:hypothetical protein